ncbi:MULTISPECIES: hypothetical protein [unclassified Streptomyces]|uniref:hypothetical protein n=1 Tax=unclassified Streptomyces TaxID=2593676 RepID=UPI00343059D6
MNALGAARTGWDLGGATLWSTQEPCGMCAAAAEFTGVGEVRYLAPDPWALEGGSGTGAEAEGGVWLLAANVMFLRSVWPPRRARGAADPDTPPHRGTGAGVPPRRLAPGAARVPRGGDLAGTTVAAGALGCGLPYEPYLLMPFLLRDRAAGRSPRAGAGQVRRARAAA